MVYTTKIPLPKGEAHYTVDYSSNPKSPLLTATIEGAGVKLSDSDLKAAAEMITNHEPSAKISIQGGKLTLTSKALVKGPKLNSLAGGDYEVMDSIRPALEHLQELASTQGYSLKARTGHGEDKFLDTQLNMKDYSIVVTISNRRMNYDMEKNISHETVGMGCDPDLPKLALPVAEALHDMVKGNMARQDRSKPTVRAAHVESTPYATKLTLDTYTAKETTAVFQLIAKELESMQEKGIGGGHAGQVLSRRTGGDAAQKLTTDDKMELAALLKRHFADGKAADAPSRADALQEIAAMVDKKLAGPGPGTPGGNMGG